MKIRFGVFLLIITPSLWANNALQDEYYSDDMFRAIEEAKVRTHYYDYSRSLRYNRTTSQSIQIPRLLNQEMAKTIIETPDETTDETAVASASSKTDTKIPEAPGSHQVQPNNSVNFGSSGASVRAYINP